MASDYPRPWRVTGGEALLCIEDAEGYVVLYYPNTHRRDVLELIVSAVNSYTEGRTG